MSLHQILNQDSLEDFDNNKVILRDETIKPKKIVSKKKDDTLLTEKSKETKATSVAKSNKTKPNL